MVATKNPTIDALVQGRIEEFARKTIKNLNKLSSDTLVKKGGINPVLISALGIKDFKSLARFCIFQRAGRSLVTSFGSTIENILRDICGGERGKWWDIVVKINGTQYYFSVKSGPQDMNKDQIEHFATRARELLDKNPKARPVIAMSYGKIPLGVIKAYLVKENLDPKKHAIIGKELYRLLTGDKNYYQKILKLTRDAIKEESYGGKTIIEIIESKVNEIAKEFEERYRNIDELLLDTF